MQIYYFSGTGNSLHVARSIVREFPGAELMPIASFGRMAHPASHSEVVGFVFPIHLTTLPRPVKTFMEGLDLASAEYIFAVTTRIGTFQVADIHLDNLLRKKGKSLSAFYVLDMTANSPCGLVPKGAPGFKKMTRRWVERIGADKVAGLDETVHSRMGSICGTIAARGFHRDGRSRLNMWPRKMTAGLMSLTQKITPEQTIPFYADGDCTGCGTCERVCLSGRIAMAGGRPVWRADTPCYYCFACFNCCPEQALLIADRYTEKKGRYLHPGISPEDIAAQKLQ
jgi:ferredoxin